MVQRRVARDGDSSSRRRNPVETVKAEGTGRGKQYLGQRDRQGDSTTGASFGHSARDC